jgi:hypothetical protein
MCIFLSLCKFIYKSNFKNFKYKSNYLYGIYRLLYTYIHVQIHIRAYTSWTTIRIYAQIENQKKRETKPFSLGWYNQPRLKGWGLVLACPPPLVPVRDATRD